MNHQPNQEQLYRLFDCITIEGVIPGDLDKFVNFLRNPPACPYTGRPAFETPKMGVELFGTTKFTGIKVRKSKC